MNTATKPSKTIQKYLDIINSGSIKESEIISMHSLMNSSDEACSEFCGPLADNPLTLSEAQNEKGYAFLMGQWKTPRGVERKNNPFGYREQSVLEDFSHFELCGLYDAGNMHHRNLLPLYNCYSKDGHSFQYYYDGKVQIVG